MFQEQLGATKTHFCLKEILNGICPPIRGFILHIFAARVRDNEFKSGTERGKYAGISALQEQSAYLVEIELRG